MIFSLKFFDFFILSWLSINLIEKLFYKMKIQELIYLLLKNND